MRDPETDSLVIKEVIKVLLVLLAGSLLGTFFSWFAAFLLLEVYIFIDTAQLVIAANDDDFNL